MSKKQEIVVNETVNIIETAFKAFKKINQGFTNPLEEISIKRSQMVFAFEDPLIVTWEDLANMTYIPDIKPTDVTCFNNQLYVSIRDLTEQKMTDHKTDKFLRDLYNVILILRDNVCECPALEYVITEQYLKVYLDVPNIQLSSLGKLSQIFGQDPFVEFTADRPYLIFINEEVYNE